MGEKRTVAILGSGRMARVHLRGFLRHPGVGRIVCWGRNEKTLAEICRGRGDVHYRLDYEHLLREDRPWGVSVCLPPHLRRDFVIPALEAGAHVLCEKPLAMTVEEAEAIAAASEKAERVVMVGYSLRYLPEIQELRSRIEAGELGDVRFLFFRNGRGFRTEDWFDDPERSLGAPGELGVHGIDLARWLIGDEIVRVKTEGERAIPGRRVVDNAVALIRFRKGAVASIGCSLCYPFFEGDLAVVGTHKTARIVRGQVVVRDAHAQVSTTRLFREFLLDGLRIPLRYLWSTPYRREIAHFIECAEAGVADCDARWDVKTVAIALAMGQSGPLFIPTACSPGPPRP
jgi:predicted dehydrogenase